MNATDLDFRLLNDFQRGFPLVAEPWAAIGAQLGCAAPTCSPASPPARRRQDQPRRAGVRPQPHRRQHPRRDGRAGGRPAPRGGHRQRLRRRQSQLPARAPLQPVVRRQRRHEAALGRLLADMGAATGCPPIALPLLEEFHIDLGFDLASGRRTRHAVGPPAAARLSAADWPHRRPPRRPALAGAPFRPSPTPPA
jgi:hypothetical protein